MARSTVTFRVRVDTLDLSGGPGTRPKRAERWLKPDGALGGAADAVAFTFYRSPTPRDRHAIEVQTHELAGLEAWVDLQRGIESTTAAFTAQLEAGLWPAGRPEAAGEDYLAQQDALAAAWDADDSSLRRGLSEMLRVRDRLRFLAAWKVLIVDPPAGWSDIAERDDIDEELLQAIWNAHSEATASALLEQAGSSAP